VKEALAGSIVGSLIGMAIVFGLLVLLLRLRAVPFDRRNRADRGRLDLPLWSGNCAATRPVVVRLDPAAAAAVVRRALEEQRVRDLVVLDPWTVAGWTGITWRSYGQQVGITVQPQGPDTVTLWCCSRPRLATTLFDMGASAGGAAKLVEAVGRSLPADVLVLR
jgi:hypothetical protein